jgi:hypothetical protein
MNGFTDDKDAHNKAAISDRSFAAIFDGTGLESVLDRGRCKVHSVTGGDDDWSVQVTVALLPQRPETPAKIYSIAVGGIIFEDDCLVVLVEGDEHVSAFWSGTSLMNERFTPEHGQLHASVVDILFEGVCRAATTILRETSR